MDAQDEKSKKIQEILHIEIMKQMAQREQEAMDAAAKEQAAREARAKAAKEAAVAAELAILDSQVTMTNKGLLGASAKFSLNGYLIDFIDAISAKLDGGAEKVRTKISSLEKEIKALQDGGGSEVDGLEALLKNKLLLESELEFYGQKTEASKKFHDALNKRLELGAKHFEHMGSIGRYQSTKSSENSLKESMKPLKASKMMIDQKINELRSGLDREQKTLDPMLDVQNERESRIKALDMKKQALNEKYKPHLERLESLKESLASINTRGVEHAFVDRSKASSSIERTEKMLREQGYTAESRKLSEEVSKIRNEYSQQEQREFDALSAKIADYQAKILEQEGLLGKLNAEIAANEDVLSSSVSSTLIASEEAIKAMHEDAALELQFREYLLNLDQAQRAAEDFYCRMLATYLKLGGEAQYADKHFVSSFDMFNRFDDMHDRYHIKDPSSYRIGDDGTKLIDVDARDLLVDRYRERISSGNLIVRHLPFKFSQFNTDQRINPEDLFDLLLVYYALSDEGVSGEMPAFLKEIAANYGINNFELNTHPVFEDPAISVSTTPMSDAMGSYILWYQHQYQQQHQQQIQHQHNADDEDEAEEDVVLEDAVPSSASASLLSTGQSNVISTSLSGVVHSSASLVNEGIASASTSLPTSHSYAASVDSEEELLPHNPADYVSTTLIAAASEETFVNEMSGGSQLLSSAMYAAAAVSLESHVAHNGNVALLGGLGDAIQQHPYLASLLFAGLGAVGMQIWEMSQHDDGLMHDIYGWFGLDN